MIKPKVIIILGATGAGKSEVALDIAARLDAEIINSDSQQVYRSMDIGTGKPSRQERERVAHHLIDVVDPDGEFNVAIFRRLALRHIEEITGRGKAVVVCGGTGLYLKALTQGLFVGPGRDPAVRAALEASAERDGLDWLYRRLRRADPGATAWIHPNDRQRIVRALEVYELTGRAMSDWQKKHSFRESPLEAMKIGVYRDRDELYGLIDRRCEKMIQDGLLEEVNGLVERGYGLELKAMRSVGYRHMGLVLTGVSTLEDALHLMKRDTRRLAKRQLTWFRRDREVLWLHPGNDREKITQAAANFFFNRGA